MTSNKTKTLTDQERLNNRTNEIAEKFESTATELHEHLMDIAKYVVGAHPYRREDGTPVSGGDSSTAAALYTRFMAMSGDESHAVIRTDAVKAWLERFAFLRWEPKNGVFKRNAELARGYDEDTHWGEANATPWNKFKPESTKAFRGFDLRDQMKQLLDKATDAKTGTGKFADLNEDEKKKIAVDNGMLEALHRLLVNAPVSGQTQGTAARQVEEESNEDIEAAA